MPPARPAVAVTRPQAQAQSLCAALQAAGFEALPFPLLEITPLADPAALDALAPRLTQFDLAYFVSPNAVEHALARLRPHWPAGLAVAAVGPSSAAALQVAGLGPVIQPSERYDSEAVLALPAFAATAVAGKRVLILRGEGGRELLADSLRERGAEVECVACYRRSAAHPDPAPLLAAHAEGRLAALLLTSSEAVDYCIAALGSVGAPLWANVPVIAPHARIAERARAAGAGCVVLSAPGDAGLLAALANRMPPPSVKLAPMSETPTPESGPLAASAAANSAPEPASRPHHSGALRLGVLLGAIALAYLGWQAWDLRRELADTRAELARRLAEADGVSRETRTLALQGQDSLQDLQAKFGALEAQQAELLGQQSALTALTQEFARSRDERVLAEVEQALVIAGQQLQLAANVPAALLALESADARLAAVDRPHFLPLRKAIAREMATLRALPVADVASMALQVETLIGRIDDLPLGFEHTPPAPARKSPRKSRGSEAPPPQPPPPPEPGWFERLGNELWREFRQLVRIERLDRPDPALMSPAQATFLRENLRLRLLSARLALLQRDTRVFQTDIRQARSWLERYFDPAAPGVADTLAELRELEAARLAIELPNINEPLVALNGLRLGGAKPR